VAKQVKSANAQLSVPSFAEGRSLVRFIHPAQMEGDRPSSTAFLAATDDSHLSVNSTEVEKISSIVKYYRTRFDQEGKVSVALHKVAGYNDAAKKASVSLFQHPENGQWQFPEGNTVSDAYRHRPVSNKDPALTSPSHCGVECVRVLSETAARKMARLLAKGKVHSFKK